MPRPFQGKSGISSVNTGIIPRPLLSIWLTDIRKAFFTAGVAAVLGVLIPTWSATQLTFAIESLRPWSIPLIVWMYCFTAIMPVFYCALYRNEELPELPKSLVVVQFDCTTTCTGALFRYRRPARRSMASSITGTARPT